MSIELLNSAMKLSEAERILLVEQIWDTVGDAQQGPPLTREQADELDRRVEEMDRTGEAGSSWEEVKNRLRSGKA